MDIHTLVARQRAFFRTGATLDLSFRLEALAKLDRALEEGEEELLSALKADLNKSAGEGYQCEVGMLRAELSHVRRHLPRWVKPRPVRPSLAQFPGSCRVYREPYGMTLIMAPWNYPLLLSLEPLIGALAAGNCCLLKPSAYAPASSAVLQKLLSACFPPDYVAVVEGGRAENQALLEEKFDYIFFTGGTAVGRQVMEKAAAHLTPVTLELGGKSPCLVDATAKLDLAAKRIAFGKLLNAGQTCVAPDYLLVHASVKEDLVERLKHWCSALYGPDPLSNPDYVSIINQKHFDRLLGLMDREKVIFGGESDPDRRKIQPTLMDRVTPNDPVMGEEIFGPILPILSFDHLSQAVDFIRSRPRPLALYLFSEDRAVRREILRTVPFGGGCVNDTILHLASSRLPFGGVGNSGMGAYHGKYSFDTFSHTKGIFQASTAVDMPLRYPPYTPQQMKWLRRLLK